MTKTLERTPAKPAGVTPAKTFPVAVLRKLGSYVTVRQEDLEEGDIIVREGSPYCIVRKDATLSRGSTAVLRELGTNAVTRAAFRPLSRVSWLKVKDVVETMYGNWKISPGDVVLYPGTRPQDSVAAVRQTRGWHRTAAPWTPLSDAEILLDLRAGKAVMIRSSARPGGADPQRPFHVGSMVASRKFSKKDEPSVWVRPAPNLWVSSSRGAVVSDQMIRYEMRRGTYQVLQDPWNLSQ